MNKLEELRIKERKAWMEVKETKDPYELATSKWSAIHRELKKEELREELLNEIRNENDTKAA